MRNPDMRTTLRKSVDMLLILGAAGLLAACDTDGVAAKRPPVYPVASAADTPLPLTQTPSNTASDQVVAPENFSASQSTNSSDTNIVVVSTPAPPPSLKLAPSVEEIV